MSLWGPKQIEAIKFLKLVAKNPPHIKFHKEGKRMLQTGAVDHYLGLILMKELEGHKFYWGYASGQFKLAESITTLLTKKLWQSNIEFESLTSTLGVINLGFISTSPHS